MPTCLPSLGPPPPPPPPLSLSLSPTHQYKKRAGPRGRRPTRACYRDTGLHDRGLAGRLVATGGAGVCAVIEWVGCVSVLRKRHMCVYVHEFPLYLHASIYTVSVHLPMFRTVSTPSPYIYSCSAQYRSMSERHICTYMTSQGRSGLLRTAWPCRVPKPKPQLARPAVPITVSILLFLLVPVATAGHGPSSQWREGSAGRGAWLLHGHASHKQASCRCPSPLMRMPAEENGSRVGLDIPAMSPRRRDHLGWLLY